MVPLLVIADEDDSYVSSVELKFLEKLADHVNLEVITEKDYFDSFFGAPHDIECLIVSEQWAGQACIQSQNIAHCFQLMENQAEQDCFFDGAVCIYKYSSLNIIYNSIVSRCKSLITPDEENRTTKVILFYSPVGGSGKTTGAIAVAAALKNNFRDVLYIDAEDIQVFDALLTNGKIASDSQGRAMLKCRNGTDDAYEVIKPFIIGEEFDYLPPLRVCLSSYGLSTDYYCDLIESVVNTAQYDYVVVDTDSSFNAEKAQLIGLASYVIVPVLEQSTSLVKVKRFLDSLSNVADERLQLFYNKSGEVRERLGVGATTNLPVSVDGFMEFKAEVSTMKASQLGTLPFYRNLALSF